MKKLSIFIVLLMFFTTLATAQLSLSFNAGANHYKTTIGYKVNNLVPYIGVDVVHGVISSEYVNFDEEKFKTKGSITLIMPNIGLKAFLIAKESIKGGVNVGIYKPLLSGKLTVDGEEDKDFADQLNNFSSFGGELGFFAEYFLADQFSIGGEFGLRFANAKLTNPDDKDEFVKFHLGGTYTSFSANYYF